MSVKTILGALSGATFIAMAALWAADPETDITVPEGELQAELAAKLPITRQAGPATVRVTEATLDFRASGLVDIAALAELSGAGLSGLATIDASSGIRYAGGKFYLRDLDLGDIDLQPNPDTEDKVADTTSIAKGIWSKVTNSLDDEEDGSGAALERMRERVIDAALPAILENAEARLRTTPVYDLADLGLKGSLAQMALRDIDFDEDGVVVTVGLANAVSLSILALLGVALAGAAMGAGRAQRLKSSIS